MVFVLHKTSRSTQPIFVTMTHRVERTGHNELLMNDIDTRMPRTT